MGFKNYLKELVLKMDVLSDSESLRMNKKRGYETLTGSFLSFLLFILTFIGSIYFGKDLWTKEEPIAIVSAKDFSNSFDSIVVDVNELGYNIYLAVEDRNFSYFSDPRIFNFTAFNEITITNENNEQIYNRVNLEISQCNQYYSSQDALHINQQPLDVDMFFCLKPNQTQIRGYWGFHHSSYIRIYLSKCVNSTENNNHCMPIEQIDDKLTGGMLSTYSENHLLDINNFESPLKRYFKDIFYSLNIEFTFTLNIILKPIQFITDSGFILQNVSELSKTYLENSYLLYYGRRDAIIADLFIALDPLGTKVSRSYLKFQDVLTKIGGLIKAFSVIGSFIVKIASNVEFVNDYIHNLNEREASLTKEDNKIINNYTKENKSGVKFLAENNASRLPKNLERKEKIVKELNQINKDKSKLFNIPRTGSVFIKSITSSNLNYKSKDAIADFFIQIIPCFNSKTHSLKRYRRNIRNKINHAFSIETILEKVYMIEVLSNILLDEDQFRKTNQFYIEALKTDNENKECNTIFNLEKLSI